MQAADTGEGVAGEGVRSLFAEEFLLLVTFLT